MKMKKTRPEKIEYKIFDFELKSIHEDDEFFSFEGHLSTFNNEDRGGEIVIKGAFVSLKEHNPSLLWSHKNEDPPLGVFDLLKEDDIGLFFKARMPKSDDFVKNRIIPQIKIGAIHSMSMGYSIIGKDGSEVVGSKRLLKKIFLWEGSLVTIPMNELATIKSKSIHNIPFQDDVPIADRQRHWDRDSALGRIREWAGVTDSADLMDPDIQDKYKRAFLWYDKDDPTEFDSYRLLIMDVIGGVLTVIPRAIFTAAARIQGGRFDFFIRRDDLPDVIRTIEKYYEKMGIKSPFDQSKAFKIESFIGVDEKTLETLFNSGICMSKKNSRKIISFIKSGLNCDDLESPERDVEINDWSDVFKSIKTITSQIGETNG